MSIPIPPSPSGVRPSTDALLKGILDFDQYDDWLPDPIYYEDQRLNEERAVQRIDRIWQSGQIDPPVREVLSLPRSSGQTVPAVNLPLDARVCAHGVIASMAPRTDRSMIRDKVYGFEFQKNRSPLFSQPGDGLGLLFSNTLAAARHADNSLKVMDVVAFSRSASMASLETTLQTVGARADETGFVRQLIQPGPRGLPSIDDAFAYLYNFYLHPVDQSLASASANFFRYRDEYYAFDGSVRDFINQRLSALGLTSRLIGDYDLDVQSELSEKITRRKPSAEKVVGTVIGGNLVATYECESWGEREKVCITDSYEVRYRPNEATALRQLFQLQTNTPLDAIQLVPLLRAIHRRRKPGVLLRPPFASSTAEFNQYRQELANGRAWLQNALRMAISTGTSWQITWLAPLLSDLGPLDDTVTALMRQAIASPRIAQAAKSQLRLALARCSTLPAEQFWANPPSTAASYHTRSALLAARYLANRGNGSIWQRVEGATNVEPELKTFLLSNINGVNR